MGIIAKWTRSAVDPPCPDEYVDDIDSDKISRLRAGRTSTRSWARDEEGRLRCYTFWADLEIDHGNPATVRLVYRKKGNGKLLREGSIILGTSTFSIADGQSCGTLAWVADGQDAQEPMFVAWYDCRTYHKSLARPKQAAFRLEVMEIFGSRCAITGCTAQDALEAAHVVSVSEGGGYAPDNGILLRRDIHRLFDLNLVAIDPQCLEVNIADEIADDYREYAGAPVDLPDGGPKASNFGHRWKQFSAERVV